MALNWTITYDTELSQISKLEEQGQNRSAYVKAEELLDRTLTDHSIPGIIASIDPLIRNSYRIDDNALSNSLQKLASLQPDHPVISAVVNSYLAELLTTYYERNRYRISQTGKAEELTWDQVNRWSGTQVEETIDSLYLESVEPAQLRDISSNKIVSVMDHKESEISWALRPRLYDLLQERLIQYLRNNRLHWNPSSADPDQAMIDLLLEEDLSGFIQSQDSDLRIYPVIKAFHQWEQSLKKVNLPEAYLDVIQRRVNYINQIIGEKNIQESIPVLQSLIKKYPSARNRLGLDHEIGQIYFRKGDYVAALQTLTDALENKTENTYENNIDQIQRLIKTIKAPELKVEIEEVYDSKHKPLASIQFRNIGRVRLELYPIEEDEFVEWRFTNSKAGTDDFRLTSDKESIWEKTINLPEINDFKSHRTEVLVDRKLEKGPYVLRYWYKKDTLNLSGLVLFQVTDLTLINASDENDTKLYVVNRWTGEKINGANVQSITIDRNSRYGKQEVRYLREVEPGSFMPPTKERNIYYKVRRGHDTYISPLTYQRGDYDHDIQPFQRTTLLTDRAVYKPGQTMHFKALITLSRELESELVAQRTIELSLRNTNGKEVWNKTLTTDDWGTVTGSIPIPTSGLKGNWSLQATPLGHVSIQVEEYQRPHFELIIADSSITRQDSLIRMAGEAKTYHGFPVQNGQGEVRVELQQRHWFYWGRPDNSELIFSGTFQTDDEGQFSVSFEGVDPPRAPYRYGSFYFYSIHVTVQASSGEIREITKEIPLDPDKKQIQFDLSEFQMLDELSSVRFQVRNALGEGDSMRVEIQVSQLEAPEEYKVDRYWELPDLPLLTEDQFENEIDQFFYRHRSSMDVWQVRKELKTWTRTIADQDSVGLTDIIKSPGYYRIMLTSTDGDTLKSVSFGVTDGRNNTDIVHDAIEILPSHSSVQPGETVVLNFYTPAENEGGKIMIAFPDASTQIYDLDENSSLKIKVEEEHRGGIRVNVFGFLANRFYNEELFVEVPWTNKELEISGLDSIAVLDVDQDTSMNISVLDSDGKGVNAEVAVAIYDASLDAYKPHNWALSHSFFRNFTDPFSVDNISGQLGELIYSGNNYWKNQESVEPVILPQLPFLQYGYRNRHYFGDVLKSAKTLPEMAIPAPQRQEADMAKDDALDSSVTDVEESQSSMPVKVREDFAETILFAGKVKTDSSGRVNIPFHTNDKTGRWKILIFAHTTDLKTGVASHTFETTQEIFLESYMPGMVRQGDRMDLTFTLYNITDHSVSGQVQFEMKPLFSDDSTIEYKKNLVFDLESGKSAVLSLPVKIEADETGPLIFTTRVVDDAGKVWDATEETIPVFQSSEVVYDGNVEVLEEGDNWSGQDVSQLVENGDGQVTIRIVQNMYSELLKSIPFLQSSNPVTTDQYFRNGVQALLGQYISGEIPNFEKIYEEWKRKGELESRLSQNEDKKYVVLENTPWVRRSDSGTEQMALLGLYFDEDHINQLAETNLSKWAVSQNSDGGFPWIKDGPSSFYITVRFLTQWEKMKWAGVTSGHFTDELLHRARKYVDSEFLRMWKEMKEKSGDSTIYYSRFTSYFAQRAYDFSTKDQSPEFLAAWGELKDSIYANWPDQSSALRAKTGIAAWHLGDKAVSREVVDAFVDNAIRHPELGTYWRYNHQTRQNGYLEILSSITELLILNENSSLDNGIIRWVLVNKMTNDWQQNPHVTSLMLSLLKMSDEWTTPAKTIVVNGGEEIIMTGMGDAEEFMLDLQGMESFQIRHIEGPPIWVGVMTSREIQPEDVMEQSGDILHIEKIVSGDDADDTLRIGDQLVIKLRVSVDRDMDYVYIQDPLIPGMDPGISLSGFKWQLGLSYYQSFDKSSAQFFIQHLPKGEYVLEYNLGVVRSGQFRHPRTTVQSYFVPEINGQDQWKPLVKIIN